MTKLRVIVVDDEPLARAGLKRLLGGERDVEVVAECEDGPTAIKAVRQHRPDLLLLDIKMPGMDGFEVLQALGEHIPAVVFVTAFDEHAVRAFEARALDYLLKPTTRARLREALARARERCAAGAPPAIPPGLLELLAERESAANWLRRIAVRNGERVTFVATEDVDWIEAAGNYAVVHVGKETHILRETMSTLESQLPPKAFLRVSRSAILNLRRVQELQAVAPGENVCILKDGQRVPMTRTLREVEEKLRFL
jgi:two-component system, LytTR family, response regulator